MSNVKNLPWITSGQQTCERLVERLHLLFRQASAYTCTRSNSTSPVLVCIRHREVIGKGFEPTKTGFDKVT
jgi:hypothetical protein